MSFYDLCLCFPPFILFVQFSLCWLQGAPKFSGMVEDCCCDYETVDHLNEEVLNPSLQELVKTPFFRYFKVFFLVYAYIFSVD